MAMRGSASDPGRRRSADDGRSGAGARSPAAGGAQRWGSPSRPRAAWTSPRRARASRRARRPAAAAPMYSDQNRNGPRCDRTGGRLGQQLLM